MAAKPFRIGELEIPNRYCLAPMAGVTDISYRQLCSEMGAGLLGMEMVSAKAITYGNKKTRKLMDIKPKEKERSRISLQLFGCEPDIMAKAARMIADVPYDILDVNMGCPVPKVVNNGEGSALMKNPRLAAAIIKAMAAVCDRPVTAKIRSGFDENHINAVELAKRLEDAGAAAIAVHARTREQYYSGKANRSVIAQVKEAVDIPVIGNGDIRSPLDARRMMDETGCDAVMIGRAAQGNPWIFRDMVAYEETGRCLQPPDRQQICDMLLRHCRMMIEEKGEYVAIREMRKHAAWYTAGLHKATALRRALNTVASYEELEEAIRRDY